jgi:ferritin
MSRISPIVEQAWNEQINNELFSFYSYLAMSAYCEHQQFTGCAQWLRMQSEEELAHAMRLYTFLIARGGRVRLAPIEQPTVEYGSISEVFLIAYDQEQRVTEQIESLYELALGEKAFAALVELEWFIKEQVEEEKTSRDIVHKFQLVQDDPASLLDLDRELGARAQSPATTATP